jgi:hypothetical protein
VIGIVFPVYYEPYGSVPLIVRRFIKKLEKTAIDIIESSKDGLASFINFIESQKR